MTVELKRIQPIHIDAESDDLKGNGDIGRYFILTGCRDRAKKIGNTFIDCRVKTHARGHDLYLGDIHFKNRKIAVAAISTGMGCPSTDNILNELIGLGAKRFLRIGTAGSLQPKFVQAGDVVIATASVRDEHTSRCYVDLSYPAVASHDFINSCLLAAKDLDLENITKIGIVHTKDSLYAREYGVSNLKDNAEYMENLKKSGVLATEMESSLIFTLCNLLSYRSTNQFTNLRNQIKAGAVLAIVGDKTPFSEIKIKVDSALEKAVDIGIQSIKRMYEIDCGV